LPARNELKAETSGVGNGGAGDVGVAKLGLQRWGGWLAGGPKPFQ
jgi:hypothetical protein